MALEFGGLMMLGSLTNVTTVSTTRISAAATVQPISSRVLPWIWAATRALLGPEPVERVDQRALDDHEHDGRDVEDDLVQRGDLIGVRRAPGLRGDEVRQRARCQQQRNGSDGRQRQCHAPQPRIGARRGLASVTAWRKAPHSIQERGGSRRRTGAYRAPPGRAIGRRGAGRGLEPILAAPCASSRGIRVAAWTLVAAGRRGAGPATPAALRRRLCSARRGGARGAVRGGPAQPGARHGALRAEHVGLPGGLQDASRRPRAARRPRPRRLPDRDRPRARARRHARLCACSGAFSAPGTINRFERVLVWCHWMWFAVPHVSVAVRAVCATPSGFRARQRACTPCSTSARCSTGRSRPRRRGGRRAHGRLDDGAGGPRAPDDDRVRGAVLGRPLGRPLRCPWRKSASCHAVAALRYVADGAHLLSEVGPVAGAVGWTLRGDCSGWRSSIWASTTRSI